MNEPLALWRKATLIAYLQLPWCLAEALQWSVMLFRRRVSLKGGLHLYRRAYDEMAAYNAQPHTRHGAQR